MPFLKITTQQRLQKNMCFQGSGSAKDQTAEKHW